MSKKQEVTDGYTALDQAKPRPLYEVGYSSDVNQYHPEVAIPHVYICGMYYNGCEENEIRISPKQALVLLDWLSRQRSTLEDLAHKQA